MSEAASRQAGACRADAWLWRARFFKTRSGAAKFIEEGRVRLTRTGQETRLDKPARPVKVGDALVFAVGGRLIAVRVEGVGDRRGPPAQARTLYSTLDAAEGAQDERGSDAGPIRPCRNPRRARH